MKKNILLIVVFLLGLAAGLLFPHIFSQEPSGIARQIRQGGYSLINPLLECDIGSKALGKNYTSFQNSVVKAIDRLKSEHEISDMAVYFRDLNNGLTFGVNANDDFTPASLLKLPIMMAYYKQAENHPSLLSQKLTYTGDEDLNEEESIKPQQVIQAGKSYTVGQLIQYMIVDSDNNAMALLVNNMDVAMQDKVYKDLGVSIPGSNGTSDFMSAVDYSAFFRILYNASYLNADYSQKALELLSRVDFAQGLRAGVPKNVLVANKFGERTEEEEHQLHDCGIIYYKDNPYLLCVMSRGSDFTRQAHAIQSISSLVYQEVADRIH